MDSLESVARPLLQMAALDAAVQLVGWAVSAVLQVQCSACDPTHFPHIPGLPAVSAVLDPPVMDPPL